MKLRKEIYRTAMYLRLSKGDLDVDGLDKSESNSITNQRMIVENFLLILSSDFLLKNKAFSQIDISV